AQEVGGNHRATVYGTLNDTNPVELDLQMQPIGAVHVLVADSFGHAVPGATLELDSWGYYGYSVQRASASANADALFQQVGMGALTFSPIDPVPGLRGSANTTIAEDAQVVTVTVALQPTATVQGTLYLADGVTPAVGAEAALAVGGHSYVIATDGGGA